MEGLQAQERIADLFSTDKRRRIVSLIAKQTAAFTCQEIIDALRHEFDVRLTTVANCLTALRLRGYLTEVNDSTVTDLSGKRGRPCIKYRWNGPSLGV